MSNLQYQYLTVYKTLDKIHFYTFILLYVTVRPICSRYTRSTSGYKLPFRIYDIIMCLICFLLYHIRCILCSIQCIHYKVYSFITLSILYCITVIYRVRILQLHPNMFSFIFFFEQSLFLSFFLYTGIFSKKKQQTFSNRSNYTKNTVQF